VKLLLPVCLLSILSAAAAAQTDSSSILDGCQLNAVKVTHDGKLLRGSGQVHAKGGGLSVSGDEATCNTDTGELDVRGHAQVTLPARSDFSVFRYKTSVFLTNRSVDISADRVDVKDGLFKASGDVQIHGRDAHSTLVQLRADEMYMFMKIADATVSGNVRASGISNGNTRGFGGFPPEVIRH